MMKRNRLLVAGALALALGGCGVFKGHKKTPVLGNRVPILLSESEVSADKAIADIQVLLPAPMVNENWAQPGGSPSKSNGQLALNGVSRAWTAQIDGGSNRERLAASPVVSGGKLFAMDVTGTVHAFDAASGARLWETEIAHADKRTNAARFGGGVTADGDVLYATDGLGDVVALSAANGHEQWRAKPGGPLRGAPTVAGGNVYIISQDNQLYALSQSDGKLNWSGQGSVESQGVFGVAAPAFGQGTVVAGYSSGELNAYRYENGRSLWGDALSRSSITTSVSSLADIDADPVIDNGMVFALGQGGRMVALDIATGQRRWEQNFAGISTPWVAGEWVFIVTDESQLVCLARSTGKVRWISALQRYRKEKGHKDPLTWYGPVLAGNRLILTNSLGNIVTASPDDGHVTETIPTKVPFSLAPIVANSTLYTLDEKGRITAWR
ncbi:MAG: PQQ-like beta-propeller repeat protein [Pseudomonadota bacterium]|nr:PQQ-like beta-propeller repeat protein [Pseudomonadota bacterium]